MSHGFRVRVLCEDRRSERFLRRFCERHELTLLDIEVAPAGRGSAVDWVIRRYPDAVRRRRSKNFQQNLGLLVHIDGDNQGPVVRKSQLDAELAKASVPPRGADEPVALLVPTWCIETWLLHLSGIAQPAESVQVKEDPAFRPAMKLLEAAEAQHIQTSAAVFLTFAPSPASLVDARVEARRIGIP